MRRSQRQGREGMRRDVDSQLGHALLREGVQLRLIAITQEEHVLVAVLK